jgi:CheY-like chemotaxis protein
LFSVKDSGIGIAKDKIASVFEAFSQADDSISREFGGTGLGLAISNQYIKMMGSSIELKSELGEGSEFSFTLNLDIVDSTHSVKNFDISTANIAVLNSAEGISCGINKIVYQYLDAWQCGYREFNELDEIDDKVDILIVCAKLFEQQKCQNLLQKYANLKLVYIEGSQNSLRCEHKNFYLIEQPMTGSALFDRLISLLDTSFFQEKLPSIDSIQHYNGTVLVAEDNETNQMLISILLDERGVTYKIVEHGVAVLEEIEKQPYDLIFMDINMPLLDGIGATKALREKGYEKPIVSLSANVIESDTKAFKEAGMNDILKKPIIPKELDMMLEKYLLLRSQEIEESYDEVDIDVIAKSLSLADTNVVKHLLRSLEKSFSAILIELDTKGYDKELLHKLKGVAGNMRFEKLYALVCEIEEKILNLNEDEKNQYNIRLQNHLKKALENIDSL